MNTRRIENVIAEITTDYRTPEADELTPADEGTFIGGVILSRPGYVTDEDDVMEDRELVLVNYYAADADQAGAPSGYFWAERDQDGSIIETSDSTHLVAATAAAERFLATR